MGTTLEVQLLQYNGSFIRMSVAVVFSLDFSIHEVGLIIVWYWNNSTHFRLYLFSVISCFRIFKIEITSFSRFWLQSSILENSLNWIQIIFSLRRLPNGPLHRAKHCVSLWQWQVKFIEWVKGWLQTFLAVFFVDSVSIFTEINFVNVFIFE